MFIIRYIIVFYLFITPTMSMATGALDAPLFDTLDLKPTDVIHWEAAGAGINQNQVAIDLRLITKQNFTLYRTKVKFTPPAGFQLKAMTSPPTSKIYDPISNKQVEVYSSGEFQLTFEGLEPFTEQTFPLNITFLGCTERICLFPYTQKLSIETFKAQEISPTNKQIATPKADKPSNKPEDQPLDLEQSFAKKVSSGELSMGLMIIVLFLGGLATNLTPCVFPMIPITLRILGNQGRSPWLSSALYACGIIITYTSLGFGAALSGGVFGSFMASSTFNLVFSGIFVLFGVSMLGFGNFAKLQNLGSRLGSGKSSLLNTWLMGAGAGLVAAPCTGPVLGGLLAYTTKLGDPESAGILFFVYSAGFALPYLFLGGAAGKIGQLRVAHTTQIAVKLGFAAAMFGLAFYYLRIPTHQLLETFKGHWSTMAIVLNAAGLLGCLIYLAKGNQNKMLSVIPCLILGSGLFASSQWFTGGDIQSTIKLHWYASVDEGILAAKAQNKPILVDGWAEWCEACKKMDATTYQDKELRLTLKENWVLVKLDFTELTDEMERISEKYSMQGLPVTLLLPPSGHLESSKRFTGYLGKDLLMQELNKFQGQ